ncbi:MAG: Zn-ribbon domain-containing OB-fold protein [Candidatus Promineifilaceae bacterium]|nr:Zn-ribbon domain-containing OB-fold protein [Candidatus Promineifilaceae bacterium]
MLPFTREAFQAYLDQQQLMAARCDQCGALHLPPRPLCPACHSQELSWTEVEGTGRLVAFTSVYVGPSTMVAAGYDRQHPYAVGVVELDAGPRISAQLVDLDATKSERVAIGQRLRVTYIERGEGEARHRALAFAPEE